MLLFLQILWYRDATDTYALTLVGVYGVLTDFEFKVKQGTKMVDY